MLKRESYEIRDQTHFMGDSMYIVELEEGVWLASWIGDPGRTLNINNAAKYGNIGFARTQLKDARKYKPFKNGKVVKIDLSVLNH